MRVYEHVTSAYVEQADNGFVVRLRCQSPTGQPGGDESVVIADNESDLSSLLVDGIIWAK